MNILGIGIIFNRGRGIECLENALNQGWQKPAEVEVSHSKGKKSLAYQVNSQMIFDRTLLKKLRRADKLSKMAVLAASDAIKDSGIENIHEKNIGIIVATAFGAHVTTFDFLNDILDYGEANVSPTTFSNSVHNATASYISSALDIQCPTLTITQFFFSFHCALQLATAWLNEGLCDNVLVGTVEQYGDVLGYIYDCKLTPAPDGRIMPFNFNHTCHVPGEGAVFFLLGKEDFKNAFCEIEEVCIGDNFDRKTSVDLNIIDTDGMISDESVYKSSISPAIPTAAYSPLFGSIMTGSAFNCAVGALILKKQIYFVNPVKDNPHGINILSEKAMSSKIDLICCIRYNCYEEKASIYLKKKV